MSYDIELMIRGTARALVEFNLTYNYSTMLNAALPMPEGETNDAPGSWWFNKLREADFTTGLDHLTATVIALEGDPETFKAFNPANGWGSYDLLVPRLRSAVDEAETFASIQDGLVWRVF